MEIGRISQVFSYSYFVHPPCLYEGCHQRMSCQTIVSLASTMDSLTIAGVSILHIMRRVDCCFVKNLQFHQDLGISLKLL